MRAKPINCGDRFGRLEVTGEASRSDRKERQYHVRCDCGTEKVVKGWLLRNKQTRSCGCLKREQNAAIKANAAAVRAGRTPEQKVVRNARNANDPAWELRAEGLTIAQANAVTSMPWGTAELRPRYAG